MVFLVLVRQERVEILSGFLLERAKWLDRWWDGESFLEPIEPRVVQILLPREGNVVGTAGSMDSVHLPRVNVGSGTDDACCSALKQRLSFISRKFSTSRNFHQ